MNTLQVCQNYRVNMPTPDINIGDVIMIDTVFLYRRQLISTVFGWMLAICLQQAVASEPIRAGWVENAVLYPHEIMLHAKLDTGARTSSIDARDPEFITRDGENWVRMSITNRDIETVIIEAPIVRHARIKRHFGKSQTRPVILLDLCIGNVRKKEEVNLVDRTGMNYELLIGRNFLKGEFLIDPGATYSLSPDCTG